MSVKFRLLLLCALFVAAPSAAMAQEVTSTSRSMGMGDALSGGTGGSSAIFHNAAGIASALIYTAEAGYAYDARTGSHGVSAFLLDNKSNPHFGMAMAFTYETGNLEDAPTRDGYHIRGGIGTALVDGLLKLGLSGRYSSIDIDGKEVLSALILDAGIIIQPLEWLSLGVSGLNLVNGGYDTELPPTVGVGVVFASLEYGFHISGDLLFDLSDEDPAAARTWRAGGEYLIAQAVPVRLGYQFDERLQEQSISLGAGFRDLESSIGIDAAYRHNLDNPEEKIFNISFSLYF